MKKILMIAMASVFALTGLIWYQASSSTHIPHVYADDHGPKINWDGDLFNWDYGVFYFLDGNAAQCGPIDNENRMPSSGIACISLNGLDFDFTTSAYFASYGAWYTVNFTPGSSTANWTVNNSPIVAYFNKDIKYTAPNGGETYDSNWDTELPLYQTGQPFFPVCDMDGNGLYDDMEDGICTSSAGTWIPFSTPEWCSPYAVDNNNYHDINYEIYRNHPGKPMSLRVYDTTDDYFACIDLAEPDPEPDPINGICNPSTNNQTLPVKPTSNLCNAGTPSAVGGSDPWTWSCVGLNGGTTASCQAYPQPICGPAAGEEYSSAPASGLCSVGTASPVTGSGPWTWSCSNSRNDSVSCMANIKTSNTCDRTVSPYVSGPMGTMDNDQGDRGLILNSNINGIYDAVRHTTSSNYIFTQTLETDPSGVVTKYLKVTLHNLNILGADDPDGNPGTGLHASNLYGAQFIPYRRATGVPGNYTFQGCALDWNVNGSSTAWGVYSPFKWTEYDQGLGGVSEILWDPTDLSWGKAFANLPNTWFAARQKINRGFSVNCQILECILPSNPTTRTQACIGLPAHAVANTATTILQTLDGGIWTPSNVYSYSSVPSVSQCLFECQAGYNWNGSACVLTPEIIHNVSDMTFCDQYGTGPSNPNINYPGFKQTITIVGAPGTIFDFNGQRHYAHGNPTGTNVKAGGVTLLPQPDTYTSGQFTMGPSGSIDVEMYACGSIAALSQYPTADASLDFHITSPLEYSISIMADGEYF